MNSTIHIVAGEGGQFHIDHRQDPAAAHAPGLAVTQYNNFRALDAAFDARADRTYTDGLNRSTRRELARATGQTWDAADARDIRAVRARAHDSRFRRANWGLALAGIQRYPDPYRFAVDASRRWTESVAKDGRLNVRDAYDPTAGGAAFPSLIAHGLKRESTPVPVLNFERLFPAVQGGELYPGMIGYTVLRDTAVGRAKVISGESDDLDIIRVTQQAEQRATCWIAVAVEQSIVARYQSEIPNSGIVNRGDFMYHADLAMANLENRLEWYGLASANMVGLINDPALLRGDLEPVTLTGTDTDEILDAFVVKLAAMIAATSGVIRYTKMILSAAMAANLTRQLRGAGGMTGESLLSFLREKVLRELGITTVEIAEELDNIGSHTATDDSAATNIHGVILTHDGELGIQRVPILGRTWLPAVELGMLTRLYMIAQIGRPYVSGLAMSKLFKFRLA